MGCVIGRAIYLGDAIGGAFIRFYQALSDVIGPLRTGALPHHPLPPPHSRSRGCGCYFSRAARMRPKGGCALHARTADAERQWIPARYQSGWMLCKTPQMPCKYLIDRRWRKPRHARASAPWQFFASAFTDTFTGTFTGVLTSAFAHAHLEARLARGPCTLCTGRLPCAAFCAFFT